MKTFNDLKVGDTVYYMILDSDLEIPIKVRREIVTVVETVKSGTIIKTEDLDYIIGMCNTYGYFIDQFFMDYEGYAEKNGDQLHCDKFVVQDLINKASDECQKRFTRMLNLLKLKSARETKNK